MNSNKERINMQDRDTQTICCVAILKNEQRFLDEWLVYHKMIGIDHFFLYDHEREQKLKDFLTPHADYLTVINYW
ncbi:MAG TPA: glycosyltransferase family 2 protein, partial [Mucilaginibacter sp.]|nr:glycosyltransferase family 2 protein [Mucilaginibacter sp.]